MKNLIKCFLASSLALVLLYCGSWANSVYAAWGLDASYGNAGIVFTPIYNQEFKPIALQADGKAIVSGSIFGSYADIAVARYNTNGTPDTTFGTNGVTTQDLGYASSAEDGVVVQTDGKIVVGGEGDTNGNYGHSILIGRYNSDGTPDTSYGSNGVVKTPISGYNDVNTKAIAMQADQSVILVGATAVAPGTADIFIARYTSTGALDQSFGNGGFVVTHPGSSGYDEAEAVTVQGDGKILVWVNNGSLLRYNADGSVDTTFGNNGIVSESVQGAFDVALQSDGKILVTGGANGSPREPYVIRYNTDGTRDTSFGNNGMFTGSFSTSDSGGASLLVQSDGKIVVGGWDSNAGQYNFALWRLTSSGSLDTSFGNGGSIITNTGQPNSFIGRILSYNGKIIAGGPTGNFAAIAQYIDDALPVVSSITVAPNPVQINSAISASASFTDADTTDTHTAKWDWGDNSSDSCPSNSSACTLTESNGSGTVSGSHSYTATGVYTVTLTVTDNKGGAGTSTYQYVAVYDSTTSFAGGHSFDNPATASPNTSGKVSFGISSKYNNSNVLTGSVKMNFKAASLDFASTFLTSLATSNGKAYLKGSGTLNGTSGYTFLASGIDGSVAGGNDLIRFQIKDSSNNVVYDSQPGAGDTADPTTTDATGNIRVH